MVNYLWTLEGFEKSSLFVFDGWTITLCTFQPFKIYKQYENIQRSSRYEVLLSRKGVVTITWMRSKRTRSNYLFFNYKLKSKKEKPVLQNDEVRKKCLRISVPKNNADLTETSLKDWIRFVSLFKSLVIIKIHEWSLLTLRNSLFLLDFLSAILLPLNKNVKSFTALKSLAKYFFMKCFFTWYSKLPLKLLF